MPRPLPSARCALTAPFHLSPGRGLGRSSLCGTFPEPAQGPARRTLSGTVVSVEPGLRSEEHTSELQSLMRISYAVFCLKNKNHQQKRHHDVSIHHNTHQERG